VTTLTERAWEEESPNNTDVRKNVRKGKTENFVTEKGTGALGDTLEQCAQKIRRMRIRRRNDRRPRHRIIKKHTLRDNRRRKSVTGKGIRQRETIPRKELFLLGARERARSWSKIRGHLGVKKKLVHYGEMGHPALSIDGKAWKSG